MRVATFNMLHGIALRDARKDEQPDAAAGHSSDGTRRTTTDRSPNRPAASRARAAQERVWSPDASDPSPLYRAAAELADLGPLDVVALQEVDRYQDRSGHLDQTAVIAEAIGAKYWRFAASVHGTPGVASEGATWVPAGPEDDLPDDSSETGPAPDEGPRYGVALLSRWPVREWRVKRFAPAPVSLPLLAPSTGKPRPVRVPDEPRTAIAGILELPHADVTVAAVHLTFVPGYNTKQLQLLKAFLAGMPRPMVLLGDFNLPGTLPALLTGWHQVARTPTYPVTRPRVQFDHVMADGWTAQSLAAATASTRSVALPISDHAALIADFPYP